MLHSDFEVQFTKLKLTYGEKAFPPIREEMFWLRYEKYSRAAFESAVNWLVLSMPPLATVIVVLDEQLKGIYRPTPAQNDEYKENANAKELADYYAPKIKELIRRGAGLPLPYDPTERIALEDIENK